MTNLFRINILAFLALIITSNVFSQKLLHEFTTKAGLSDFSAISIGDSILFSYEEKVADTRIRKSKWITDSTVTPYHLPINVFSAVNIGDEVYLYFLNGKTKSRELNAIILNPQTNTRRELNTHLPLQGTIIGSYVNKNLFVLLLQDKGSTISIIEINKLNIITEKKFKLPVNISFYLQGEFSGDFFSSQSNVHSFKGNSRCKIFNHDKIYLTIDQRSLNAPWKTLVMTLDPFSNTATSTEFSASSNDAFSSFILEGKLFRAFTGRKKFSLEIYNLESKKLIAKSALLADQKDFPVYFRYGRKNEIHTKTLFSHMRKSATACEPSLVVLKNEGKYFIQWGTYYNDNGMMAGPASPAGMIATLIGTLVLQLAEGPGMSRYFYYEWNEDDNVFSIKESPTQLIRNKIDNYEIAQHRDYKYKNYLEFKDGVVGIYYDSKTNTASIVNFD